MSSVDLRGILGSLWKRPGKDSDTHDLGFPEADQDYSQTDVGFSNDGKPTSNLPKGQMRRAQVRKAQKEHRERKKNLVKFLEQDVITWRQKLASAQEETFSIQGENEKLRILLSNYNLSLPLTSITQDLHRVDNIQTPMNALRPQKQSVKKSPTKKPNQKAISVRTSVNLRGFDDSTDFTFLQISQTSILQSHSTPGLTSPDIFNFSTHDFGDISNSSPHDGPLNSTSQTSPPGYLSSEDLLAEIAVNFILALEHPCRTHFHPASTFDPHADPTGHELMASTSIYTCAPSHVFQHSTVPPSQVAWNLPDYSSPLAEVRKLREMNEKLPKDEDEVTPVQAWFFLVERYDLEFLMGSVEVVKRELCELVECFAFGAVMNRGAFWEAVERVVITSTLGANLI